jgi:hypothetical protein
MKIILHSNSTVEEIKEEFNNSFPYLNIVFVTKKADSASASEMEEVDPLTRLTEVGGIKDGDISIQSTDTIKDVEQRFEKQYGLSVHIFRKQKGVSMDTSVTDDLTLHEQNTWGREASKPLKIKMDDGLSWNKFSLGK